MNKTRERLSLDNTKRKFVNAERSAPTSALYPNKFPTCFFVEHGSCRLRIELEPNREKVILQLWKGEFGRDNKKHFVKFLSKNKR
jgi:hypothetical protein